MNTHTFGALLLAIACSGCAAQLGTGWTNHGKDVAPRVIAFTARTFEPRHDGPMVGLGVSARVGGASEPLRVRNATVSAGYHLRTRRGFPTGFGGEWTLDLGLGEPSLYDLGGIGGYLGTSTTLLWRLAGQGDDVPRFDVLSTQVDLALAPQVGLWTPPEGASPNVVFDAGIQLALRVTLSTDLGSSVTQEVSQ